MEKDEKINLNNDAIDTITNEALKYLIEGRLEEACYLFNEALKKDYSNLIAETGAKCCKYWIPRINKIKQNIEPFKKGKFLIEEWSKFKKFLTSLKHIDITIIEKLKFSIFNFALKEFQELTKKEKIYDLETTFYLALSLKRTGYVKEALEKLERALTFEPDNSNIISQIADCYGLLNEEKKAKLLFKEAFFIDSSSIQLELIDTEIILYLIEKIKENEKEENEIRYWILPYGIALNIFNIVREMLPTELLKLKKEIKSIENLFNIEKDRIMKAKLLGLYLWYYDYLLYFKKKEEKELLTIEENIKNISDNLYKMLKSRKKGV